MTDKDVKELKDQIRFEQFVGSFYLDLIANHGIKEENGDNYYKFIMELVKEIKENSKDAQELNTNLKNLPGTIFEKIKTGEMKDLLDI
jgi:hypothetical protein